MGSVTRPWMAHRGPPLPPSLRRGSKFASRHRAAIWICLSATVVGLLAASNLLPVVLGTASFQAGVVRGADQAGQRPTSTLFLRIAYTGTHDEIYTFVVELGQMGRLTALGTYTATVSHLVTYTFLMPVTPPANGTVDYRVLVYSGNATASSSPVYVQTLSV